MVVRAEQIEPIIENLRQAAEANRQTPCRRGNLICLDAENSLDVLVSADLHGNRVNFEGLLGVADLGGCPQRHLIMQEVCHGGPTYPMGNACMSHLLLEDMAAWKNSFPERFHFILSNHELAELTDFPIMKANRMLNLVFRNGLKELYGTAAELVRGAYLEFLRTCPVGVRLESGIFISHSAPDNVDRDGFDTAIFDRPLVESDFEPHSSLFRLVWGRDFRRENAAAFAELVNAKVLIHGHEPCPDGFRVPNDCQVILDSCGDRGCYVIVPTIEPLTQQQVVERIQYI